MAAGEPRFGGIHFIHPLGTHKATIVWLHDIGVVENLQNFIGLNSNVKWIFPTAPERPISALGGQEATAWFDFTEVSENMHDDFVNLNYVNSYIDTILSQEPENVIKGVAGLGLGAAQALYYTSCFAFGWVSVCPQIVIGINGWLPGWKFLEDNMNTNFGSTNRARSIQISLLHETGNVVPSAVGYTCAVALQTAEFPTSFKHCEGNDAMNEIRDWLINVGL